MLGAPDWALDDEMVTMRPHPAASMSGSAACTQANVPVRLTATMRSHCSAVMSSTGVKDSMPALVTRISTGPSSARTRSTPASTDGRSATSTSRARTFVPSASSSAAAVSSVAGFTVEEGDAVTLGDEPAGHAEADAGRAAGDDGDPAHELASTGSNSRCSLVRPRRIHVGS